MRIAIIGASYLQLPLIRKAKKMGLETHVFAWECGDVAEKMGLTGNDIDSSLRSANKYLMKKAFIENDVPAALCKLVENGELPDISDFKYPLIVKPTDRLPPDAYRIGLRESGVYGFDIKLFM